MEFLSDLSPMCSGDWIVQWVISDLHCPPDLCPVTVWNSYSNYSDMLLRNDSGISQPMSTRSIGKAWNNIVVRIGFLGSRVLHLRRWPAFLFSGFCRSIHSNFDFLGCYNNTITSRDIVLSLKDMFLFLLAQAKLL